MKKWFLLLMILAGFCASSCDLLGLNESKTCGDKKNAYHYRTSYGTGFFTDGLPAYVLDRTYSAGAPGGAPRFTSTNGYKMSAPTSTSSSGQT
jgi:hypothetical protein